jgi:RHS repeat-associated protein
MLASDHVGDFSPFAYANYANGVTHAYSYDTLNRLTQVGASANGTAFSNYAYTLGLAGNRLTVAELSGRTVNHGYDSLYRLTSETVTADPHNNDGTGSYTYDNVGNRKTFNTTIPPAGGNTYTYDADDRLGSDQYDEDGNTINSLGTANTYDFENHLATHGGVTVVYDGDGNRVSETVGGITTNYLVDSVNPTGYAQVVDELVSGTVTRTYSYGLERISEKQASGTSFYGYDGHGSVRQLSNSAGAVTDSYDYDAFGNLINSTGSTPNNYLFAGEQFDPALGLYYNRARYYNNTTGRFWSMDTDEGDTESPFSLHKYLYVAANPVNLRDRSGNDFDLGSTLAAATGYTTIFGMSAVQSAVVILGVTGALFSASLSGIGAALEGQSPGQIQDATGNLLNMTLGALTAIAGPGVAAYDLGAYALAIISLGGGGWTAYNQYQQGNCVAAVYYGTLGALGGILSAAVPYLRGQTQTPPTVVLKGANPSVTPSNLTEQLVLAEAEANAGTIVPLANLADAPRLEANYGGGQWAKAQWVHYDSEGNAQYTVHYFIDLTTGERVEFKFTKKP